MVKYPTEATIVQHRHYSTLGKIKYFLGLQEKKYDGLSYELKFTGHCCFDFDIVAEELFQKAKVKFHCPCRAYGDVLLRLGFERVSTGTRRDGYILKNYHLQNIVE